MDLQKQNKTFKWVAIFAIFLGLLLIYVTQQADYLNLILSFFALKPTANQQLVFTFNKTLRLLANDFLCIGLIRLLFGDKKYVTVAFLLFCVEFFIILPVYIYFKLSLEGDSEISSPLLSQIHRLIINPLLMFLLMVSFFYLRTTQKSNGFNS